MFLIMYLQAHHIDLDFYDEFYKPGAYLKTHANHMTRWHSGEKKERSITEDLSYFPIIQSRIFLVSERSAITSSASVFSSSISG